MHHHPLFMITITENYKTSPTEWLNDIIRTIQVDQIGYETDTLNKPKKKLYDSIINGNIDAISEQFIDLYKKKNVYEMVSEFINQVKNIESNEVYLNISGNEVLAWIVIPNDSDAEKDILRAEAIVNYKYNSKQLSLCTLIAEEFEGIEVPSQYLKVELKKHMKMVQ